MRTMWAGVVRRWESARASWPHPLWAGFLRRTWRMKLTAAGTTTALAWGAWAVAEVKPAGGTDVNTILVGVLASLAALVVVLANILGKTVTQLSEYLPRKHQRNGERAADHAGDMVAGHADAITADDPDWRGKVLTAINGLRLSDEELRREVKELGLRWAAGRASDEAATDRKIEDHHNMAMMFLSKAVDDIELRLGNRVEKKVGECMDTLRAQVANVVKDAVAELSAVVNK